eukprot:TRINITY_DN5868_c0_g1_i1.p1 TRINITY_DN5868_c0_g1~~TRINITY_DN5868_c0_g1_i1.p1  ORF type:complete len:323 (+),score=35.40 TRINITY_DN5868_c0_g1_i1:3-971(+)
MLKRSHRAINTFAMLKLNNLRLKPGEQQPPSLPQLQTLAKATWNRLNDKDTTDPDDWFDKVKSVLPFAHFESPDPTRERPPNTLRLVCISDTHEREVKNIPDGDVLIHAGDFTLRGSPAKVKEFNDFIARQPHKHKVVIAGNHDLTFDEVNFDELRKEFKLDDDINAKESKALLKDCIYLEDTGVQIDGVIFFGSPHQPEFCGWAFNEPRGDACRRRVNSCDRDSTTKTLPLLSDCLLCFSGLSSLIKLMCSSRTARLWGMAIGATMAVELAAWTCCGRCKHALSPKHTSSDTSTVRVLIQSFLAKSDHRACMLTCALCIRE